MNGDADAARFALVEYADGSFGILRDGRPLDDARYPHDRLGEGVRAFMRLSHEPAPPRA